MCRKEAAGAPVRVEEKLTEEVMMKKMKIYLLQNQEDSMNEPTDVGIVIKGITAINNLGGLLLSVGTVLLI